jgi:hypothetical protein
LTLEFDYGSLEGQLIKIEVNMVKKKEKKVRGVGINNADYAVYKTETVNGKSNIIWRCPYYSTWDSMLRRCYYEPYLKKYPTYQGCSVCDDWIYFMTFKAWMETKNWQGKDLDKDILVESNKVYSPETCRFVDRSLNMFLCDSGATRGEWPLGVYWQKAAGKFQVKCKNPFTKKSDYLGLFNCPEAGHLAWRKRKHELACQWADLQDDLDIAEALRKRFAPN